MKNACFIIPYFGKLPVTMPAFLRSCGENPDFNWLILTDDHTGYDYPENVQCLYCTFSDFVHRVQSFFDFPIALSRPYKICDFRAAFGLIFAEELKNFRFWGHCDLDQYFGKISNFITNDILEQYDKILCLGHFTLFRNTEKINEMYLMTDQKNGQGYRQAFSEEKHWIFDEWPETNASINRIMKQQKVKTFYRHDAFCDLVPFCSRFQRYIFDHETERWVKEKTLNMVFIWDKGKLLRYYYDGRGLVCEETLYVHIRQRKMDMTAYHGNTDVFSIIPNRIVSFTEREAVNVRKLLFKSMLRSILFPDEISRMTVMLSSYYRAARRRLKKILQTIL